MKEEARLLDCNQVKILQDHYHIFIHLIQNEENQNVFYLNFWEISQENGTSQFLQSIQIDYYKYHMWSQNTDHIVVFTKDSLLIYGRVSPWEIYWHEQFKLQTIQEPNVLKGCFSFPILYVIGNDESFLVNVTRTTYHAVDFGEDFQPASSNLSYDGQYLAISARNNESFKIFTLDNLILPDTIVEKNSSDQLHLKSKEVRLPAQANSVVQFQWKEKSNYLAPDVLTVVYDNNVIQIYEVFENQDMEDDAIVAIALNAAISAGVVNIHDPVALNSVSSQTLNSVSFCPDIRLLKEYSLEQIISSDLSNNSLQQLDKLFEANPNMKILSFHWIHGFLPGTNNFYLNNNLDLSTIITSGQKTTANSGSNKNGKPTAGGSFMTLSGKKKKMQAAESLFHFWCILRISLMNAENSNFLLFLHIKQDSSPAASDLAIDRCFTMPLGGSPIDLVASTKTSNINNSNTSSLVWNEMGFNFESVLHVRSIFTLDRTIPTHMEVYSISSFRHQNLTTGRMKLLYILHKNILDLSFKEEDNNHYPIISTKSMIINHSFKTLQTTGGISSRARSMSVTSSSPFYASSINQWESCKNDSKLIYFKFKNYIFIGNHPILKPKSATAGRKSSISTDYSLIHLKFILKLEERVNPNAKMSYLIQGMSLLTIHKEKYLYFLYQRTENQNSSTNNNRVGTGSSATGNSFYFSLTNLEKDEWKLPLIHDISGKEDQQEPLLDGIHHDFYSVEIIPDLHFGLGIRLDETPLDSNDLTKGVKVIVSSFKPHPVTKEAMSAELSGLIQPGDELIAINETIFYHRPLSEVIPGVRSLLSSFLPDQTVKLRFLRPPPANKINSVADSAINTDLDNFIKNHEKEEIINQKKSSNPSYSMIPKQFELKPANLKSFLLTRLIFKEKYNFELISWDMKVIPIATTATSSQQGNDNSNNNLKKMEILFPTIMKIKESYELKLYSIFVDYKIDLITKDFMINWLEKDTSFTIVSHGYSNLSNHHIQLKNYQIKFITSSSSLIPSSSANNPNNSLDTASPLIHDQESAHLLIYDPQAMTDPSMNNLNNHHQSHQEFEFLAFRNPNSSNNNATTQQTTTSSSPSSSSSWRLIPLTPTSKSLANFHNFLKLNLHSYQTLSSAFILAPSAITLRTYAHLRDNAMAYNDPEYFFNMKTIEGSGEDINHHLRIKIPSVLLRPYLMTFLFGGSTNNGATSLNETLSTRMNNAVNSRGMNSSSSLIDFQSLITEMIFFRPTTTSNIISWNFKDYKTIEILNKENILQKLFHYFHDKILYFMNESSIQFILQVIYEMNSNYNFVFNNSNNSNGSSSSTSSSMISKRHHKNPNANIFSSIVTTTPTGNMITTNYVMIGDKILSTISLFYINSNIFILSKMLSVVLTSNIPHKLQSLFEDSYSHFHEQQQMEEENEKQQFERQEKSLRRMNTSNNFSRKSVQNNNNDQEEEENDNLQQDGMHSPNPNIFSSHQSSSAGYNNQSYEIFILSKLSTLLTSLFSSKDLFASNLLWHLFYKLSWIELIQNSATCLLKNKNDLFGKNTNNNSIPLDGGDDNDEIIYENDSNNNNNNSGGGGGSAGNMSSSGIDFSLDRSGTKKAATDENNQKIPSLPWNDFTVFEIINLFFSSSQGEWFEICFRPILFFIDENDPLHQHIPSATTTPATPSTTTTVDEDTFSSTSGKQKNLEFVDIQKEKSFLLLQTGCQLIFNRSLLEITHNEMINLDLLSYISSLKVSFWLHDMTPLFHIIYKHALKNYRLFKSSMKIFLEMVIVGRVDTLLNITKADGSESGKQLLSLLKMVEEAFNPYNTDKEKLIKLQNKLRKNAFALIRKHRYREAAAVFLLCPSVSMIKSAQNVLAQQYRSPFFAHLISRLMEARLNLSLSSSSSSSSSESFFANNLAGKNPNGSSSSMSAENNFSFNANTTGFSSHAFNIDFSMINEFIPDNNNSSAVLDRSTYVLGIFSSELMKKDILPGLLTAAETTINEKEKMNFPYDGRNTAKVDDHIPVHFETIGYHGIQDYPAILMAILCSLWLQEEEILENTFDTIFPLMRQYLNLLASSTVPSAAPTATTAGGGVPLNSSQSVPSFPQKRSTTTIPSTSNATTTTTTSSALTTKFFLSERWKLILQIRHSFLYSYKISHLYLIMNFLETTFHQHYLYLNHQMILFFYSFPFFIESSYYLSKEYTGKVLTLINEFYDFYHLTNEKLHFHNYYFLSTNRKKTSTSSDKKKSNYSSTSSTAASSAITRTKKLAANAFFKYAKNYYNKSVSHLSRSTINDMKFLNRQNSVNASSNNGKVEGSLSADPNTTQSTAAAAQANDNRVKFNFASMGKPSSSAASVSVPPPPVPHAEPAAAVSIAPAATSKSAVATAPAAAVSLLDQDFLPPPASRSPRKPATTTQAEPGKSAPDMFDVPPPRRPARAAAPPAPPPAEVPAAASTTIEPSEVTKKEEAAPAKPKPAAVDPFQAAASALDAFDFNPPARSRSRAAAKKEEPAPPVPAPAPPVPAAPVAPVAVAVPEPGPAPVSAPTTAPSALDAFDSMNISRPAKSSATTANKNIQPTPAAIKATSAVPATESHADHKTSSIPPQEGKDHKEKKPAENTPAKKEKNNSTSTLVPPIPAVPHVPAPAPDKKPVEQRIREFYEKYNPTKISSIPSILEKYKGKEHELIEKLKKQYNVPDI